MNGAAGEWGLPCSLTQEDSQREKWPFHGQPAAPFIYGHSPDSPLLGEDHARIFHRDVATALYPGNRTRLDIVLTLGELCKRVQAPTEEDDRKLDE